MVVEQEFFFLPIGDVLFRVQGGVQQSGRQSDGDQVVSDELSRTGVAELSCGQDGNGVLNAETKIRDASKRVKN